MTNASRSNKFNVLNMPERGLEFEDVNAVDVAQEIVEITVDLGSCQERMADPREGCCEDKCDEDGEAGGSKRQSDTCGRRHEIGIVLDGKKCNMKFLDASVKRSLVSVSAIVDEGHTVVFRPQESYVENRSIGQRIPMNRRQGVCSWTHERVGDR